MLGMERDGDFDQLHSHTISYSFVLFNRFLSHHLIFLPIVGYYPTMPKDKISISLDEVLSVAANQLVEDGGAGSMSAYIEQLIARDLAKKGRVKPGARPPDLSDVVDRLEKLEARVTKLERKGPRSPQS